MYVAKLTDCLPSQMEIFRYILDHKAFMKLRSSVKAFDEEFIFIVKDKGCDSEFPICELPICEFYIG